MAGPSFTQTYYGAPVKVTPGAIAGSMPRNLGFVPFLTHVE